ncbi:MAG: 6-hydroxymethylpterin diphosphokinase MptE-like protein [Pseudomonadota bacterium]
MNRLDALKNRHIRERCVLVANGPSLNAMDLSFLKHEIVFGLNKIHLGLEKFGFYPKYYAAVNEKVIQQSAKEIHRMGCIKFIGSKGGNIVPESALTYHINTANPPARFCSDISLGVHEGWTVTYVALQIAYFLGFSEIILIGLDHRYIYDGKPNETRQLKGPDQNHFSPSYFGYGQHWDNPDLSNSEESYRIAKAHFDDNGRRIIDATVDGACEIFPKADYKKIFLSQR